MSTEKKFRFDTLAVHAGQEPDPATNARAVPIYQTTSYVFNDADHAARLFALQEFGNIYTRIMNPTTDVFEKRMAALEGGVGGLAVAAGQAAETFADPQHRWGRRRDRLHHSLYGGTYNLFHHTLPRARHPRQLRRCRSIRRISAGRSRPRPRPSTPRSIGNPKLDVLDIEAVAAIAHEHGHSADHRQHVCHPYLCRPIEWGADIVIHSATKWIGGHGNSIGGVIVDSRQV